MRQAPATDFSVTHFGWWRGAIVAVSAMAAGGLAAWAWQVRGEPLAWAAATIGVAAIVAALSMARPWRPVRLRWDGEHWHVDAPSAGEGDAPSAPLRLLVALDLGPWMLLRLVPAQGRLPIRAIWIPVQRRGHEAQWHGMRRAVYFPRPSVGGPPGAEPHLPE